MELSQYLKRYTILEEQKFSFYQIFVMELSNMGLIAVINGFDYFGIQAFLFGGSKQFKATIYPGFNSNWYHDIG